MSLPFTSSPPRWWALAYLRMLRWLPERCGRRRGPAVRAVDVLVGQVELEFVPWRPIVRHARSASTSPSPCSSGGRRSSMMRRLMVMPEPMVSIRAAEVPGCPAAVMPRRAAASRVHLGGGEQGPASSCISRASWPSASRLSVVLSWPGQDLAPACCTTVDLSTSFSCLEQFGDPGPQRGLPPLHGKQRDDEAQRPRRQRSDRALDAAEAPHRFFDDLMVALFQARGGRRSASGFGPCKSLLVRPGPGRSAAEAGLTGWTR